MEHQAKRLKDAVDDPNPSLESILVKFLPRTEGGDQQEMMDKSFGFPARFLITLSHYERVKIINALKVCDEIEKRMKAVMDPIPGQIEALIKGKQNDGQ